MAFAFLTDVCGGHLNDLNLKLQGKILNIFEAISHLDGFKKKLNIFKGCLATIDLSYFPCCATISLEIGECNFDQFAVKIKDLLIEFEKRFRDFDTVRKLGKLFYDPMGCSIEEQDPNLKMELCDLQSDCSIVAGSSGIEFWKHLRRDMYPKLSDSILKSLSMFPTSYVCECAFSSLKNIK